MQDIVIDVEETRTCQIVVDLKEWEAAKLSGDEESLIDYDSTDWITDNFDYTEGAISEDDGLDDALSVL